MIFTGLMQMVLGAIKGILSILPAFPATPAFIVTGVMTLFTWLSGGLEFLSFFVRLNTIVTLAPIVILIAEGEDIYNMVMWVLRKLPFLNIN
ncbi:hypothetical protein DWY25_17385 [Holdemania filiformis]|uniref:Uncharacterized protein n=1 Tax=Holdemania filiformis TaxID=61171 RepID=A0A412FFL3_9FIRM|nr:hypothetical protein [Holdemania filiformis]RGR66888.1 hypothetical protein DWY25_17385 [Holdemania filiformis]